MMRSEVTRRLLGSPENQPVPANRWPDEITERKSVPLIRSKDFYRHSAESVEKRLENHGRNSSINSRYTLEMQEWFIRLVIEIRSPIVDREKEEMYIWQREKIATGSVARSRPRAPTIIRPRCQSIDVNANCQFLRNQKRREATESGDYVANTPRRARRRTAWPRWPRRVTSRHRASRSAQPPLLPAPNLLPSLASRCDAQRGAF